MGRPVRQLPAEDTLPRLLLTLTAVCGEYPSAHLKHLPGGASYIESMVTALKQKGLLRTYYRDGLRGLRLTTAAKRLLLNHQPERFTPYLTGCSETNRLKSEVPRRLRLHRMAEVLVAMYNAGVLVFSWEKPSVFQPVPPPSTCRISQPAYYNSREMKEMGCQADKISSSRSTGVLLTDGGIFIAYNTGPYQMKWEYKAEMRLKVTLQTELCRCRLPSQYMDTPISGIVFASDMGRLDTMVGADSSPSNDRFLQDGSFEHFYFLTCDHNGEAVLRLLCDGELRAALDDVLSEDLQPPDPGLPIENDAIAGNIPVLFGYTCDMPRLRRFDNALSIHEKDGLVICFDFQEEAYRRCCGPHVQLQCLDLEACERSVFPSPEKKL